MRLLIIITLLSFPFWSAPALAQSNENSPEQNVPPELQIYEKPEVIKKLMELEKEQDHEKVFETIRSITDGEEMQEALLWLRTRVMADDTADPRYALLYAESLLRIIGDQQEENLPLMETAAMVYLYGHLTLAVDAQRCLNRDTSWNTISFLLDPFEELIDFYKNLPEHKRRDVLTVAMRLEDRVSGREPNMWICTGEDLSEIEEKNVKEREGLDRVENELLSLMQEFDLQPQFVSTRIWRERRDARRRAFARQFR